MPKPPDRAQPKPTNQTMPSPGIAQAHSEKPAAPEHYLTSLTPAERIGLKRGAQPVCRPVTIGGKMYRFGLWAQPAEDRGTAQISFQLQGQFARLCGVAGISDAPAGLASSSRVKPSGTLRIYGDGNLLWESDPLAGYGASQTFAIGVQGVEFLALVVQSDAPADVSLFAWADLKLSKNEE